MPEGIDGLAEFTLVLQDIATLDVAPSDGTPPANITPQLFVTLWATEPPPAPTGANSKQFTSLQFRADRVIRPECAGYIEEKIMEALPHDGLVAIPMDDWERLTTPYHGQRTNAKPGAPATAAASQIQSLSRAPNSRIRIGPTINQFDSLSGPPNFGGTLNPNLAAPSPLPPAPAPSPGP
jgi:hypothetical protein